MEKREVQYKFINLSHAEITLLKLFGWLEQSWGLHLRVDESKNIFNEQWEKTFVLGNRGETNFPYWHNGELTGHPTFKFTGTGNVNLTEENFNEFIQVLRDYEKKHNLKREISQAELIILNSRYKAIYNEEHKLETY